MDLLAFAKNIADRIETAASRTQIPVAVSIIDIHGNMILQHRITALRPLQSSSPSGKPTLPRSCACARPTFSRWFSLEIRCSH